MEEMLLADSFVTGSGGTSADSFDDVVLVAVVVER